METPTNLLPASELLLRKYLTYKEWKPFTDLICSLYLFCKYLTYKEWKPSITKSPLA